MNVQGVPITPELRSLLQAMLASEQAPAPTVRELFKRWEKVEAKRMRAWKSTKCRWPHLLAHFGDTPANQVTRLQVDEYRAARAKQRTQRGGRPVSVASRNREVASLRALLNWAVDRELLRSNPIAKLKMEQERNIRQTALGDAEVDRLLKKCDAETSAIVLALYESGMRRLEVLELRWDEIDIATGRVTLRGKRTKNGKPRKPRLLKRSLEAILALPKRAGDPHVFRQFDPTWRYELFRRAVKAARLKGVGGEPITFHTLRHSFIAKCRREGVPDRVAMSLSGHLTRSAFDRYGAHIAEAEIEAALVKLQKGSNNG